MVFLLKYLQDYETIDGDFTRGLVAVGNIIFVSKP